MTRAKALALLFGRGWLIVTMTAANVGMIAHGAYGQAMVVGFGISFVWYTNTGRASDDRSRAAQVAYSLGAAAGSGTGIWLAGLIAGRA